MQPCDERVTRFLSKKWKLIGMILRKPQDDDNDELDIDDGGAADNDDHDDDYASNDGEIDIDDHDIMTKKMIMMALTTVMKPMMMKVMITKL